MSGGRQERSWYLAGPVVDYGTRRRSVAREWVRARAGYADMVLDPEQLWSSARAWLTHWPALRDLVTDLVVLTAADGTVGGGVMIEVMDARRRGVQVWRLSAAGRFTSADGWRLRVLPAPTLRRFARWEREPRPKPLRKRAIR